MSSTEGRPAGMRWHYDRVELIADGVVHVLGVGLGLAGAISLVILTANSFRAADFFSVMIYAVGLVLMLGLSAAYNLWPVSPTKWVLRRFDHSAIYVMIAGSFTPFAARMESASISCALLVGVWLAAAAGITLKLVLPGRFDRLAVVLYLLFGWCGVAIYVLVPPNLPSLAIWLLAAGGLLYSAGVIFHAWRSLRFQNAIWHGFVLVAAGCHYSAILDCVIFWRA